jgi:hypothetical protein
VAARAASTTEYAVLRSAISASQASTALRRRRGCARGPARSSDARSSRRWLAGCGEAPAAGACGIRRRGLTSRGPSGSGSLWIAPTARAGPSMGCAVDATRSTRSGAATSTCTCAPPGRSRRTSPRPPNRRSSGCRMSSRAAAQRRGIRRWARASGAGSAARSCSTIAGGRWRSCWTSSPAAGCSCGAASATTTGCGGAFGFGCSIRTGRPRTLSPGCAA